MQFGALLIAALAAPLALAQNVVIKNSCTFPVYVQPNSGAVMTLASMKSETMALGGPGSAIKLATTSAIKSPLTLEYTPSGSTLYYDISNNAGNPFNADKVSLVPSRAGCFAFHCAPNSGNSCYSNGSSPKVKTCAIPTNLDLTLCG